MTAPTTKDRPARIAVRDRRTNETTITLSLNLDGSGVASVSTGLGFLDHMLVTLARFARFDLNLTCQGDTHVDDHHTVEDCALALGAAIDQALGDRAGIARFASAYAPLDEALARVVVDLSGRPWPQVDLRLERDKIGDVSTENIAHFFVSLAMSTRAALHVDVLRGNNDHHRAEAAFKALALAYREAVRLDGGAGIPSTKGVL